MFPRWSFNRLFVGDPAENPKLNFIEISNNILIVLEFFFEVIHWTVLVGGAPGK